MKPALPVFLVYVCSERFFIRSDFLFAAISFYVHHFSISSRQIHNKLNTCRGVFHSKFFQGFSLGTCFDVIKKICDYFIEKKKTIVMNLGASFLSTKFPKELKHLFGASDVIFGNEEVSQKLNKQM